MKFCTTLVFLSMACDFALAEGAGPKIARVVAMRPRPVFERVEHPAAAVGRKLVVVEVPKALQAAFETAQLNVGVIFSSPRPTDNCNQTKIYGLVTERDVPTFNGLTYGVLEIRPGRISKTLKDCEKIKHEVRAVEIVTELRGPSPMRDTLVFDVPEDVDVNATFWSPIATAVGVRAN